MDGYGSGTGWTFDLKHLPWAFSAIGWTVVSPYWLVKPADHSLIVSQALHFDFAFCGDISWYPLLSFIIYIRGETSQFFLG